MYHSAGNFDQNGHRSTKWRLRSRTLDFPKSPLLMGIVNVTPDSFSDGGKFFDSRRAVDHALQLAAEGADILDIGGESTRPYAEVVDETEELKRVVPVIQAVAAQVSVPISIDTSKAKVAEEAIAAGAEIVNDVTGCEGDEAMIPMLLRTGAAICAMHMLGNPQTMQDNPTYQDVVGEIHTYLGDRLQVLQTAGIERDKICLDPGIGFGKTHQHNLELMAKCDQFHTLGQPLLVGHSRKGFIAKVLGHNDLDRTMATVGATMALAVRGIQVVRVHDIRPHKEAINSFVACGGLDGIPLQLP